MSFQFYAQVRIFPNLSLSLSLSQPLPLEAIVLQVFPSPLFFVTANQLFLKLSSDGFNAQYRGNYASPSYAFYQMINT